jgi:hypothetical protein
MDSEEEFYEENGEEIVSGAEEKEDSDEMEDNEEEPVGWLVPDGYFSKSELGSEDEELSMKIGKYYNLIPKPKTLI